MDENNYKPFPVRYDEARSLIINSINSAHTSFDVPWYLIEPIVESVYRQIAEASKKEIEGSKQEYMAQLTEQESVTTDEHD